MNPLRKLGELGQSPWLDYIDRDLLDGGELKRLVEEDGLKGVTSNPSIFAKAIGKGSHYDDVLRAWLAKHPDASDKQAYEFLAVRDIREACDVLRPVYDDSGGNDGFVSLEVAPDLAADTEATVDEARRLWGAVDRPNLMIKVPATPEGLPAITRLIGEGVNVNVTLMFSIAHYDAVAGAYLSGLELLAERHPERLGTVRSVASVFVSRLDSKVDPLLEADGSEQALALRGKVAISNARQIYRRFQALFQGEAFEAWAERGAAVQRVLWGSTSTKNPAYSDVLYVDELIGPHTVNTLPPRTMDAFRDHGDPAVRLTEGLDEAQQVLDALPRLGIDLSALTEELQQVGVEKFAASFEQLLGTLADKRASLQAA